MRGILRWIRADVRARGGQLLAAAAVIAGVVTALLLSAALLEGATNPWQGLFNQTRGAQIWLRLAQGTSVRGLAARVDGVTGVAGPYPVAAATLAEDGTRIQVQLRAMGTRMPQLGRMLVRQGSWLRPGQPDGVVLESSLAQAIHVSAGSTLLVGGLDGNTARVRVTGLADTSDQGFYPDQTPGLMWVPPGLLHRVEPVTRHTQEEVGLRIADPAATGFVVQQMVTQLGSRHVISVATWQQVKQSMARKDPLLGLLLALFGLVALGAAVLAILNATGGRVLLQLRDLAMLKTLGFTPGQVAGVLVAEHAVIGAAGIVAGLAAERLLTAALLDTGRGVVAAATPVPGPWALLIAGGTELAVVLATAVPSLRAGLVSPVAAVRPAQPRGRLSRLARTALESRLPPAIVLGARGAFVRRLPAALTIGGLAVPMLMITIGLGFWATLDDVQQHPADIGLAAALTVSPGALSSARAWQLVESDPQVAAVYRSVRVPALLPGETTTVTTLGTGTSARPFPFHVAQGRLYRAPGEAVASQGLLDVSHLRVGDFVRMPIGGVPVIFHIVGRIIEPEYSGQVLAYGRDTLSQAGAAAPAAYYSLVLRPGVPPGAARARLLRASANRLDVEETQSPAGQLDVVRFMLAGLIAVLAVIGLTNLFTASLVGIRDHARDVGAMRAMGLTPWQVRASLLTRTSVLALVAVTVGALTGLLACAALINLGARAYGIGAGIGRPPSAAAMLAAVAAAVVASSLTATIPARHAARLPPAAVLGP
ncbi:MAG TPA: FtsX-like permease family protein [Streptosporangiaceae bacterium]